MINDTISADETYKFIIKKLNVRFHRRLGYDGNEISFINVELIPPVDDNKRMDIGYIVDGEYSQNIEHQSSPVYESKMKDIYKYRVYSQAQDDKSFRTCIFATYNPNLGLNELELEWNVNFHPDFFYTKNLKASEIINNVKTKNDNNIELSDNEAIDLILAPDSKHDFEIKELLEITSKLLVNA